MRESLGHIEQRDDALGSSRFDASFHRVSDSMCFE
jgi:hypothetical protein